MCVTQCIRRAFGLRSQGGIADLWKRCFSNRIVTIIKMSILEYNIWARSR